MRKPISAAVVAVAAAVYVHKFVNNDKKPLSYTSDNFRHTPLLGDLICLKSYRQIIE